MSNRVIKFRGKRLDNGEWVYGDLLHPKTSCRIVNYTDSPDSCAGIGVDYHYYDVDESTIGQFTGLLDKNGKEIYEGDIVLQRNYNNRIKPMVVRFEQSAFIVGWHGGSSTPTRPMLIQKHCEVLGNIHDSLRNAN